MPTLRFKRFQIEDLSRAALHDGSILSWEPGLGKTVAALAWPIIKRASRVLLVVPGGLHRQFHETAMAMFGIHITRISTVSQLRAHGLAQSLRKDECASKRTRFFMTTYQELGYNHGDEWMDAAEDGERRRKERALDPEFLRQQRAIAAITGEEFDPSIYWQGIGEVKEGIRCVWIPTLARVIMHAEAIGGGFDCVVIDEGTRLQSSESHISRGVRMLNPKYRLVLTGTPIKNRLESMFWLAWWACGGSPGPTARFPYEGTSEAREEFANQHLQHDRFLTREEEIAEARQVTRPHEIVNGRPAYYTRGGSICYIGSNQKIEKRTARICNIHRLWKLVAPIIIRRRKDECGEDIVPKVIKPITVQPGTAQLAVYRFHIDNPPFAARATPDKRVNARAQVGMQLGMLRQAALCPESDSLGAVIVNPGVKGGMRQSWTDANPKQTAILSLIADLLTQGEQFIVGSPFRCFNNHLQRRLTDAGVSSVLLDGTIDPARRGEMAARFKRGQYSGLVVGQNAMGEGNSFECCSNLILPSLSWAYDENAQFLDRIWRLNSPKPVTIYTMTTAGTIDERMNQLFCEKGDSSQLALDGRLVEEQIEEVDLATLLADAIRNFDADAATIDEQDIEAHWPALRRRLAAGEALFRQHHPKRKTAPRGVVSITSEKHIPKASALMARFRASKRAA